MARREKDLALQRAIEEAGGPAALAKFISDNYEPITTQAICDWLRCPPLRVLQVERATGGRTTRYELRPDLYPAERAA